MFLSFKNLVTKNVLAYTCYINLVEAIIRHQKLRLTRRVLRSSCTVCKSYSEFLKPGVIFYRYEVRMFHGI